jgi:hypothetical protein
MSRTEVVGIGKDGRRRAVLAPTLAESLPPDVLEGLVRRRLAALGETCPCGASMALPNRAARRAARRSAV